MKKIIICGPGGSGKDYLAKALSEKLSLVKDVSYTSRPPREGEINGVDYNFVSIQEFESMIEKDMFFEYDCFIPEKKWYYGASKKGFDSSNIFIKTVKGIAQIPKHLRNECLVIYLNPDEQIREERLSKRVGMQDSIKRRIYTDGLDFEGFTDYDMQITDPFFNVDELILKLS